MGINQANLHPKVLKNQLFIRAVDWLIDNKKVASQKELAVLTKIHEPTISNIRNDKKVVSDPTIRKLLDSFPGVFNPDYFRGQSLYMTIEEMIEADIDKDTADPCPTTHIDEGSMINMTISAQMGYIESLKQQVEDARADLEREKKSASELIERERRNADERISDLKSQIDDLHAQLADKDIVIAEQKQRLRDYRHIIDTNNLLDKGYPFPIGAADGDMRQPKRK